MPPRAPICRDTRGRRRAALPPMLRHDRRDSVTHAPRVPSGLDGGAPGEWDGGRGAGHAQEAQSTVLTPVVPAVHLGHTQDHTRSQLAKAACRCPLSVLATSLIDTTEPFIFFSPAWSSPSLHWHCLSTVCAVRVHRGPSVPGAGGPGRVRGRAQLVGVVVTAPAPQFGVRVVVCRACFPS